MNNLGIIFTDLRRFEDAIACFDRVIGSERRDLAARKNKAIALCQVGQAEAALATYEEALRIGPNDADIHNQVGILRLLLGDFANGWPEYEWRWKAGQETLPSICVSLWDGSSLDGKSILLLAEQGIGDTVQFIRYAAWLKKRYACRVLVHVPASLQPLLSTCKGIDEWVVNTDSLPGCRPVYAPLLHIPSVLRHTTQNFPTDVPYLSSDEFLTNQWRHVLAHFSGHRIGIAWRGSPTHACDRIRSIPLIEFAHLTSVPGVTLFSLQKWAGAEEVESQAEIVNLGPQLDEHTGAFVDTAAVLKNLDLLVSCDTAVAHVAGALGLPVWMASPLFPIARWGLHGETTPWYPTMRLFRQSNPGDWSGVFQRILSALRAEWHE